MTLLNREFFTQDPTQYKIPNDGVARVLRAETEQQREVLRWELTRFVCEGQYARGLERILDSFLTNLTQAQQPAVWVSGFYGSGKSHLVRVLEHLWRDVELPNGERARDLVRLTDDIRDQLVELTTEGRRRGGLWSAAGTLAGKGESVRLALLSVLFENAGLPEEYSRARFTIWARKHGYLDTITRVVEAEGQTVESEITDLHVSPLIAEGLVQADPRLGSSPSDVLDRLATQFPPAQSDITDEEMFSVIEDVLLLQSSDGEKLPLTLVVLDEMQQYINDDGERALDVQNIVEGCTARFESQLLFVATGQSALTATATLQKLTDRFAVQVALSDRDVESVVREVVLQKKPEHRADLEAVLDAESGEIDKHLGGTQLAPRAADKPDLVPDYPLLPTRRRFWEHALRAIDQGGKSGVLRTQLRIVHGAAAHVASRPAGHVVGADFLYEEQSPGMLQSGALLKEIDELIRGLRKDGADGELKSRICALVFLISEIPARTIAGETGLRATAAYIEDLLVEDLANDRAHLRREVPELLESLVTDGSLMRIDDEYRLQTEEGAEWEKAYQRAFADIRDDAARLSTLRSERIVSAAEQALAGLKILHGKSKTARTPTIHWESSPPDVFAGNVPVWIRDGWSVSEASVRAAAAEAGDESPVVFVLLPRHDAEQVKVTLASHAAAEQTLRRPLPQTDEGKAAQRAMKTRLAAEEERLETLFHEVVGRARIFMGGVGELTVSSLRTGVENAVEKALVRLFPKFVAGDDANWGKVVVKAREGAPDPLAAIGYHGEPTAHPVCKEVLSSISAGGTKGSDLQREFSGAPFGWPKDAVAGAVLTLVAAGNVRAAQDGTDLAGPKELLPTQVGKTTFYKEDEPPTMEQRLKVRGLLGEAGVQYEAGDEGAQIPALLQRLKELARRAGGAPPLPAEPDTEHLDVFLTLGGNQRFRALADDHERLSADLRAWRARVEERDTRERDWRDLERLMRHAESLDVADRVRPAVAAIRDGRQLLDTPDPTTPVLRELGGALRDEVMRRAQELSSAQAAALAELEAWREWSEIDPAEQQRILSEAQLMPAEPPDVGNNEKLIDALDATPLSAWRDKISLVPGRRDHARHLAAKLLAPESVTITPPPATISASGELDAYLDELRAKIQPHLDAGKTVSI